MLSGDPHHLKKRPREVLADEGTFHDDYVDTTSTASLIKIHKAEKNRPRFISTLTISSCAPLRHFIPLPISSQEITEHYDIAIPPKVLGKGATSVVIAAKNRTTGRDVAVKALLKADVFRRLSRKHTFDEYEILKSFNDSHPSIIHMIDAFETENDLYLVMEYCEGDLFELMHKKNDPGSSKSLLLSEPQVAIITSQLLSAVDFLHKRGIVHGDIRPENILLSNTDKENLKIKLADFGMAKKFSTDYATDSFMMSKDMYSVGLCLLFMLVLYSPSLAQETNASAHSKMSLEAYSKIPSTHELLKSVTAHCSDAAVDLLGNLLHPNAENRISVADALNHTWLTSKV